MKFWPQLEACEPTQEQREISIPVIDVETASEY
ncbi:hypothetical protein KOR42_03690 [Thalassoglobus neptunius]|uniref:Uncharacterized protein n=1 Tax=Thalassoglobus neptunius TaxID=1938619 RepID=A0A5C5X4F1_9PLAN|nr:hypothetical protein KOR42_03690 [Thalassoglobus neptunius]